MNRAPYEPPRLQQHRSDIGNQLFRHIYYEYLKLAET